MTQLEMKGNNGIVELVERGLRKGYWDKALIPELKKRFKELEKKDKLLELYKKLATVKDDMLDTCEVVDDEYYDMRDIEVYLKRQIKELENNEN